MSEFVKSNLCEPGNPSDAELLDGVHVRIANNQHAHRRALQEAYDEIDRLKSELAKAQAERKPLVEQMKELKAERDKLKSQMLAANAGPIDNGDGTATAMLPVTHPKGLEVEAVRAPKRGEQFVTSIGGVMTAKVDYQARDGMHYILRPAPQQPEPSLERDVRKCGLLPRYVIRKADESPVDPSAEYFVLRLDDGGSDPKHIAACRVGVLAYAEAIQDHLPLLANDLREKYAPQPPEPVTWAARIADGDCEARSDGVATKGLFASWWVADALGVPKPAKLGTYRFVNGVGTLIEASE